MKRAALTLLSLFALALPARGAVEDLSTWTEVDPYGYLTVGDNDVVVTSMPTSVTTYMTKDFGADYWDDFTVDLEFTGDTASHTTSANVVGVFALSNAQAHSWSYFNNSLDLRWTRNASGHYLNLTLFDDPSITGDSSSTLTVATKYYLTLTSDFDGGDNTEGLYTLYICTTAKHGAGGSVAVDTLTVTVPVGGQQAWRYAHTAYSRANGSTSALSGGTIANIEISGYTPEAPAEVPSKAGSPSPAHQATGVSIDPTLTWAAADGALNYNVYFGQGSVSLIGNQTTRSYTPAELDPNGTEYWWRIDANNVEGATTGDVWTFTTAYEYTGGSYGTTEDFNYWTLVNPQSELAATDANTITATTLSMDHSAYGYRLLGANYFSGDYTIRWQSEITAVTNNGTLGLLALADRPESFMGWVYGADDVHAVWVKSESGALNCHLGIWDDGVVDSNYVALAEDTAYFFQLERDDDAGDNSTGLLTLYISTTAYHGEGGAVDVNSIVFDVPTGEQNDYDYAVTAFTKGNHGALATISGTISYLDLGAETAPSYDPPPKATPAYPANGATGVSKGASVSWNAAANASNYNVYFGTPGDLSLIGNQTTRSYAPVGMADANEYAWRIDPNNAYGTTQGDQWTFTTGSTTSTTGSLSSVTQHGITWTFSEAKTVGQFANGDFYVVGPVTITAISPSGATQNGSMINPTSNTAQGFDSRSNYWSASTNVAASLPITVPVGSSLISTRSLTEAVSASYVGYAAVLTVLSAAPADNSFRPPYFGTDKTVSYNSSQLNYDLLYGLTAPASAPALATVETYFEGPWIDFGAGWSGRTFHPAGQMPPYGRDLSAQIGTGALMLHLDYTDEQKETLMIRFTQLGIDLHGIASHANGRTTWGPDGGHCMGRKYPILFAGTVLGSSTLLEVAEKSGAYLWSAKPGGGFYGPGSPPPDYIYFQEDAQTFFIDQYMADLTLQTCVSGPALGATSTTITIDGLPKWSGSPLHQYIEITSGTGAGQTRYITGSNYNRSVGGVTTVTVSEAWATTPVVGSSYYRCRGYEAADIGTAEWGVRHADLPTHSNPSWGADYRVTANIAFPGWTLAAHIMNMESQWNHEPLFDWMDRWMTANAADGDFPRADRGSWVGFHADMWEDYRTNLPDPIITPPATPANPTPADAATGVDQGITLRWEGFATTWSVYLGTSPDALEYQADTTIRQYVPTLEYGETYYWQVGATNSYGSTLSPVWSFTVEDEVIAAPGTPGLQTPANGATNQPTSLTLRWGATTGTTRYDVWFGTTSLELVASTTTATSYIASGLSYSTTYQWRIDAAGAGGVASSSTRTFTTVVEGETPDDPEPDGPTLPDLPTVTTNTQAPRIDLRRYISGNGLIAEPIKIEGGLPTTKVTRSNLSGYLERIVIVAEGTDTQWSLTVKDAWGGELFSASDLDMTEGVVAYDGQRLPFVEGLQIVVADTTADTADSIWVILLVDEAYRTRN